LHESIFIAGFGGQGVILAGRLICLAAMREGMYVSHIPSYGAEMRGGTANCSVIVSDEEIGSPLVKFQPIVRPGGLLIYNSSLIEIAPNRSDVEAVAVRANGIAEDCGSYRAANMVALGVLLKNRPVASLEAVLAALDEGVSERNRGLNEINRKALRRGFDGST
jgi:2-oxoglutarate ferredoxin oxidoreductase subunit gamma